MKKLFFSLGLSLSACSTGIQAQVYFQEDFGRVPVEQQTGKIPEGWVLYNDANRPSSQFSYCTDAWNVRVVDKDNVAMSPSWFSNSNARADRWMITPEIRLPESADAVLAFRAKSYDQGELETYLVLVSTATAAKEDFSDTLLYVKGEKGNWTTRLASLRAYAGKTLRLAFVQRSLDRYALYVDDIRVSDLAIPVVDLTNQVCPTKVSPDSAFSVSVDAQVVMEEPVSEYEMAYVLQKAGSESMEGTFSGKADPSGEEGGLGSYRFRMEKTDFSLSDPGTYRVRVWARSVNATEVSSDTLESVFEVSDMQYFARNTLLEVFSSSTCSACPFANGFIKEATDRILGTEQASQFSIIKYQMDFPSPGDPCVISEGLYRGDYYGVTSIPAVFLNGDSYKVSWDKFPDLLPGLVDQESADKTPFGLEAEMTRQGNAFRVEVDVTNVIPYADALLYVAFAEDSLHHDPQSNKETEFFHVVRKMLPDAYGQPVDFETGGTRNFVFEYTFDGAKPKIFSSLDGLSAVVFIQDESTGEILQSVTLPAVESAANESTGSADMALRVYPNPCRDYCVAEIAVPYSEKVSLEVSNLQGKKLWRMPEQYWSAGMHSVDVPLGGLPKGLYFIRMKVGEIVVTKKIVLC